jgi:hypothetical protein
VEALFGLRRQQELPPHERETPELLAPVTPGEGQVERPEEALPGPAAEAVAGGAWEGELRAPKSGRYRDWPSIDTVEQTCRRRDGDPLPPPPAPMDVVKRDEGPAGPPALELVRRRRSATGMDRGGTMDSATLFRMLERLLPHRFASPWDALGSEPLVDLHLTLHRVDGLEPGLYTLVRRPGGREELARRMNPEFAWDRPAGCPDWLPLYLNLAGDLTDLAEGLCCGQEMAGDAAFSLGMTADLGHLLERYGAPVYRRLYLEAGMIGQVLYLEAEAAGIRGCGIGCYFDDGVHKLLGSDGESGLRSLYHFVVGRDVPERGAALLPAYPPPETE